MNYKLYALLFLSVLTVYSCSTSRHVTQLVERTSVDTVYLSSLHYDSIYIFQERTSDYHMNPLNPLKPSETDTVFIKDVAVEFRYRLLRDTIYKTRIDTIPYEVRVVETQVVRHIPWYAKLLSWIGTLALLFLLIRVILYLRGR